MQYTAAYTHGQSACGDWRKWSTQFNMGREHTAACGLHSTGRSPAVNIASTVLRSAASIPAWWNPTPYTNSSEKKERVKERMVYLSRTTTRICFSNRPTVSISHIASRYWATATITRPSRLCPNSTMLCITQLSDCRENRTLHTSKFAISNRVSSPLQPGVNVRGEIGS